MKLIVKGRVDTSGKVALDSGMFNACIMIANQLAGQTQVNTDGEYELELDSDSMPETVELMILPSSMKPEDAGSLAHSKRINSSRFIAREGKTGEFLLSDKFFLPIDYLEFIKRRARQYHVHGTVYQEHPTYFATLPGCRIDFFEVDAKADFLETSPAHDISSIVRRQDFLGSAYTRTDGSYDFYFKFGTLRAFSEPEYSPHLPPVPKTSNQFFDAKPDIRARFYLFINGAWSKIHDAPMTEFDWNIAPDFHRDYRIPADAAIGTVDPGTKPATGFRFKSIGLLPIDTTRIAAGYAHSQPGDPVAGITHEPFCGTLRIYGQFAAAPVVPQYTVELLKTDATGTAITGEIWKQLGEPLSNLLWNEPARRWDAITLGPTADKYRNIDIEDPMDWLESSLKAVWNSANCVNGYYKLRITGYDASNLAVSTTEMPIMRIDNDTPEADFDVTAPAATLCGDLTLGSDRDITFRVTAYESDGHMHSYSLSGSRGRYAESAGATVSRGRPLANDNWNGVLNGSEQFAVIARSAATLSCATMAYSFHLCVQGAGTNGYGNCLGSKRVYRESNLVITEV